MVAFAEVVFFKQPMNDSKYGFGFFRNLCTLVNMVSGFSETYEQSVSMLAVNSGHRTASDLKKNRKHTIVDSTTNQSLILSRSSLLCI